MLKTVFLSLAFVLLQANAQKAALSIEAALVYRSGDVKPVARVDFVILDASLGEILNNARLVLPQDMSLLTSDKPTQLVITFGKAVLNAPGHEKFLTEAISALKPHVIGSGTTGFDGKLELKDLPAKPCYIVAAANAGRSWLIWNLKTELKPGQNKILLDQNNAAFVR